MFFSGTRYLLKRRYWFDVAHVTYFRTIASAIRSIFLILPIDCHFSLNVLFLCGWKPTVYGGTSAYAITTSNNCDKRNHLIDTRVYVLSVPVLIIEYSLYDHQFLLGLVEWIQLFRWHQLPIVVVGGGARFTTLRERKRQNRSLSRLRSSVDSNQRCPLSILERSILYSFHLSCTRVYRLYIDR